MPLMFLTLVGFVVFLYVTYKICRKLFRDAPFTDLSVSMKGKSILITGASDGIGECTALHLAKMGADIIFACRSESKTKVVMAEIHKQAPNSKVISDKLKSIKLTFISVDLSDLHSVVSCVEEFKKLNLKIDVLITNAGFLSLLTMSALTKQGYEKMVGVNHLAHYLLIRLLLPYIIQTKGKVITVSSHVHNTIKGNINIKDFFHPSKGTAIPITQYGCSKLFNILTSLQIHRLYNKYGIRSNSLHPGNIATGFGKAELGFVYKIFAPIIEPTFFKTIFEGSQTTLYLATSPDVEEISGKYFQDNELTTPSELARNERLAQELWDYSESLCKKHLENIKFEF